MLEKHEISISGVNERDITLDIQFKANANPKSVVLFVHGYKGFKDWGPWNLMSKAFANEDFCFMKINFSHNGVDPNNLTDITLPEVFGQNTFSIELDELKIVLDWIESKENPYAANIDSSEILVVGHSLGGSLSLIKAIEDSRISKIVAWASPCDILKYGTLEERDIWKERGFVNVVNARTKQVYPILYAFREDIVENINRFSLLDRLDQLAKPLMIIHGTADESVNISDSKKMAEIVEHAIYLEMEGATHTFGGAHPYLESELPEDLQDVIEETVEFFKL